jgi:hypothetical protein
MSPTSSSKTQRLADGTVEVVAIPPKDIFATLVLTHEAVKEHEATLSVPPPFPPGPVVDKGVVSFTVNAIPTPPAVVRRPSITLLTKRGLAASRSTPWTLRSSMASCPAQFKWVLPLGKP